MRALTHLRPLLAAGARHAPDARARRRLVVNNGIALTLCASGLSYAALLAAIGFPAPGALLVPISLLHLLAVGLNHRGATDLARALLLVNANTTVFGYLTYFGIREVSVFFATVSLPLIICDLRERRLIALGFSLAIGYGTIMAVRGPPEAPLVSASVAHALGVSLVLTTFAVMLLAILSFVVSNARAERSLDQARVGLQRLLDSVDQGFVTLDRAGRIGAERSSVFDAWFAAPAPGTPLVDCLAGFDPSAAAAFTLTFGQIEDAFLPVELLVDQLPTSLALGPRRLELAYRATCSDDRLESLLVVMSDVTAELEHARREIRQRELLALLARFASDRNGLTEFVAEAERLVAIITGGAPPADVRRALHTLKGNAALLGAEGLARACHEAESELAASADPGLVAARIESAWRGLRQQIEVFVGDAWGSVAIERAEIDALVARVRAGLPPAELAALLTAAAWEPSGRRLARIADQIRALAKRLGKGEVEVSLDPGGVRFDPEHWAPFWSAFSHVIRNAVDHGLVPAAGGRPPPQVHLATRLDADALVIEIADNGRGIDWPAVATRAIARGLPAHDHAALTAALFADGVSTRTDVSEISGRGVGLSAVKRAVDELGGEIAIISNPGQSTTFRFSFRARDARAAAWTKRPPAARPAA